MCRVETCARVTITPLSPPSAAWALLHHFRSYSGWGDWSLEVRLWRSWGKEICVVSPSWRSSSCTPTTWGGLVQTGTGNNKRPFKILAHQVFLSFYCNLSLNVKRVKKKKKKGPQIIGQPIKMTYKFSYQEKKTHKTITQMHSNRGSTENREGLRHISTIFIIFVCLFVGKLSPLLLFYFTMVKHQHMFMFFFFFLKKASLNFHSSSLQIRVWYTVIHLAIGSRHLESPRPISDKRNICLRFACWCVVPWDAHDSARPPSDRESVHWALQKSSWETSQVWLLRGSLSESVCFAQVS